MLESLLTLAGGYSVRVHTFWQDLAELKSCYSESWKTILNNCGVIQAFGFNNRDMAIQWGDYFDHGGHQLRAKGQNEQILSIHRQGESICQRFAVEDPQLIVATEWSGESTLDGEDRVELFFARDAELGDYWRIEIAPEGRVHDYHAQHYRKFNHDRNCPGYETTVERTHNGYIVGVSLRLATLSTFLGQPVSRGGTIRMGLFRAEYYGTDATTDGSANDNWFSRVRPKIETLSSHVPTAFQDWTPP